MTTISITDAQGWTLINSLHTAADTYHFHARNQENSSLRQQFEKQAEAALDLASHISRS